MDLLTFAGTYNYPIFYTSLKDTYDTIEMFIHRGVKTLYPAHGNVFSVDNLKKAQEYYKSRIN